MPRRAVRPGAAAVGVGGTMRPHMVQEVGAPSAPRKRGMRQPMPQTYVKSRTSVGWQYIAQVPCRCRCILSCLKLGKTLASQ